MATGSKGGRSYSDQSYGGVHQVAYNQVTAGTRATALVASWKAMNPITVLDWNLSNATLGTGGSSQWVLAATSDSGTSALGTLVFVGTHGIGATLDGSITETEVAAGGTINLYSVLSTAADLGVTARFSYRERFVASDN